MNPKPQPPDVEMLPDCLIDGMNFWSAFGMARHYFMLSRRDDRHLSAAMFYALGVMQTERPYLGEKQVEVLNRQYSRLKMFQKQGAFASLRRELDWFLTLLTTNAKQIGFFPDYPKDGETK